MAKQPTTTTKDEKPATGLLKLTRNAGLINGRKHEFWEAGTEFDPSKPEDAAIISKLIQKGVELAPAE